MIDFLEIEQDTQIYENAQAWTSDDLRKDRSWVIELDDREIDEIDRVIQRVEDSGGSMLDVDSSMLQTPLLGELVSRIKRYALHGPGVCLVRGLPVSKYGLEDSAIAFWVIGVNMGLPVSQNAKGHVLGHVANLGLNYADATVRGYQTNARLPYHTDASDIVGLLCLREAKSGGLSSIVSSTTLWNELAKKHPKYAAVLRKRFYRSRFGEGSEAVSYTPIFSPRKGKMFASYVRSSILKAQKMDNIPRLGEQEIEALDLLDKLAADPKFHVDMQLRSGDMQFLCNHYVFHSRTTYEDWPEVENRRHLLRLWVACDDGPDLPREFLERNGVTPTGRPEGIVVSGVAKTAPLRPC